MLFDVDDTFEARANEGDVYSSASAAIVPSG
jgi:hypothetical protein